MDQRGVGMSSDFALFERHIDALYRSALRLTRKPEDAEDLVQETYLRAYRYRNRFKPGTNEKAWLFTIMTNVFRNRLRQRPVPEPVRSEEHTSELQSRQYLVCRLLLEKKNRSRWPS